MEEPATRVLSLVRQSVRIDAEEKQYELKLAVISGQMAKKSDITSTSGELTAASSDILEAEEESKHGNVNDVRRLFKT